MPPPLCGSPLVKKALEVLRDKVAEAGAADTEADGGLRRDGAGWVIGDLAAVPVPALLRQVIAGRLHRLPAWPVTYSVLPPPMSNTSVAPTVRPAVAPRNVRRASRSPEITSVSKPCRRCTAAAHGRASRWSR